MAMKIDQQKYIDSLEQVIGSQAVEIARSNAIIQQLVNDNSNTDAPDTDSIYQVDGS